MTPALLAAAWAAVVVAALARGRPPAPPPPDLGGSGEGSRRRDDGTRSGRRRQPAAVTAAAPDLVDLFAVAVAAGLNVRLAVDAVATRAPPGSIREALALVRAEVAAGHRLADALERLPHTVAAGDAGSARRTWLPRPARAPAPDETIRALTSALVDAERYGTALGPTLDRLAAEARRARQRRAEEAARRIPVQLLLPLVTCILPAFGLLTVAPLIAGGLRALRL